MRAPRDWDIFCRVIDNFGDAAVCWRLARELASSQGARVHLWIDDLASLRYLEPRIADHSGQVIDGIEVHRWGGDFAIDAPSDVVIEAFGCGLPDGYIVAMANAPRRSLWIVLEYLSAESWVREHHGLPSPHPQFALERYFFFPGFVEGTGGLLLESDLFARRDAFDAAEGRDRFWDSVGHAAPPRDATVVSMFAYDMAPVGALLEAWERGPPTVAAIPETPLLPAVLAHFGASAVPAHRVLKRGALEARIIPFVPQMRYDELLWSCDVNFVRGEDSFVRAQWAGRPFIWHIYPQQKRAHWAKLEAFLELYCESLPRRARRAVEDMMRVWNQVGSTRVSIASAWAAFAESHAEVTPHTRAWADNLAAIGSLTANLAEFCTEKLK
jgi:uncharacterized repeat protein (TIGR03837 family)